MPIYQENSDNRIVSLSFRQPVLHHFPECPFNQETQIIAVNFRILYDCQSGAAFWNTAGLTGAVSMALLGGGRRGEAIDESNHFVDDVAHHLGAHRLVTHRLGSHAKLGEHLPKTQDRPVLAKMKLSMKINVRKKYDVSVHFYGPWSHIGCLWMTFQSTSTGLDHTLVVCEWRFSPLLRALITHWLSVNDVSVHFYGPWSHIGCLWMTFQSTSTGLDHTLVVCEWRFSPLLWALITHWLSVKDVSVHFYRPWSHIGCLWMMFQSTSTGLDHTLVVCEWRFSLLLWALITHWLSVNDVSVHFYGPWSHIGCLWMTFQSSSMGLDHTLVVCEWRFSPLLRALITHWLSVNDVSVHFYGPWSHIGCLWMTF